MQVGVPVAALVGGFGDVKEHSALAAGVLSGVLFVLLCVRSPRNLYAFLLAAIVGCLCQWNLTEWLLEREPSSWRLRALHMVGAVLLPPFYFHLALLLFSGSRPRWHWLVLAYGAGFALLLTVLLAAGSSSFYTEFYAPHTWNQVYVLYLAVVVGTSLVLLARAYRRAPRESRGVYGFPLLAGLLLAPLGGVDMALHWPVGNVGAAAAALVLFAGVFRYRGIFDSLALLRETTDRLLGALSRGVVTIGADGQVVYANPAARELLGPDVETIGASVAEGSERYVQRGARTLKVAAVRLDSPLQAGGHTHVLVQDVTRESRLLRDLAQRESLASLGESAATLAHEIRNPLTAIRSTLDTFHPEAAPSEEQLGLIRREVARLSNVLERGLTLARPLELEIEPSDLERLLRRVSSLAPPALPVRLRIEQPLPAVSCDPDLVGQVLLNLIRNADEAGAPEVEIRAAADPDARQAVLRVSNRGPGIPPEVMEQLFQPFVTTKQRGGGLGLALSRKVVTAHGGTIEARNTEGGVEFEVRLPWMS